MKRSLAIAACTFVLALAMFAPSKASAGGYWAGYGYGCCCVTYCYGAVRGGYAYPGYAYPRYGSRRYGYGHRYSRYRYPRARGYARRQLRREAIRDW